MNFSKLSSHSKKDILYNFLHENCNQDNCIYNLILSYIQCPFCKELIETYICNCRLISCEIEENENNLTFKFN